MTVFLMPIMPHLTDSIPALDDALAPHQGGRGACESSTAHCTCARA